MLLKRSLGPILIAAGFMMSTVVTSAQEVTPFTPAPTVGEMPLIVATVNRVIDGSSLDAQVAGNRTAIGYLGVDTPPMNAACGPEARALNEYLAGRQVLLREDPLYTFDEIGRRLYYVYTMDGVSIEDALISEGFGWRRARTASAARS